MKLNFKVEFLKMIDVATASIVFWDTDLYGAMKVATGPKKL